MSKKHFDCIADVINTRIQRAATPTERAALILLALELALKFHGFNDRFDPSRFLDACGLDATEKKV